jgi:hypothetical protein
MTDYARRPAAALSTATDRHHRATLRTGTA